MATCSSRPSIEFRSPNAYELTEYIVGDGNIRSDSLFGMCIAWFMTSCCRLKEHGLDLKASTHQVVRVGLPAQQDCEAATNALDTKGGAIPRTSLLICTRERYSSNNDFSVFNLQYCLHHLLRSRLLHIATHNVHGSAHLVATLFRTTRQNSRAVQSFRL